MRAGMSLDWGWGLAVLLCFACEANGGVSAYASFPPSGCADYVENVFNTRGKVAKVDMKEPREAFMLKN